MDSDFPDTQAEERLSMRVPAYRLATLWEPRCEPARVPILSARTKEHPPGAVILDARQH
jgi:hypothetical protein